MAKRSQKSRFGPSKDRIKPDTDSPATSESEDDQADGTADESEEPQAGEGGGGNRNNDQDGAEGEAHDDEPDESGGEPDNDAPGDESIDDLASAYISEEGDQNPQTCCSSCHTVFEVSRELLDSSDTRVRCGECLSIFDALANLRKNTDDDEEAALESDEADSDSDTRSGSADKPESAVQAGSSNAGAATQAGSSGNASPLDVTYADFALFSADAGLPEIDYMDETREVPPFDFDDMGDEDDFDESIDETLYAEDVIEDARAAMGDGASEPTAAASKGAADDPASGVAQSQPAAEEDTVGEIDELLDSLKKPELPIITVEEPVGAWWFRGLLFMGVLILAAGLYGYRERDALQNNHLVRPVLESVCAVFGCSVPERVDLSALKVTKRTVFSHPDVDDMLIINIGFVNQAEFSQRYPTLEILLTDRSGRLIVQHDYQPSDYLDNWQAGDVLDVGKSLDISLNMEDPGNEAMSFELDFR